MLDVPPRTLKHIPLLTAQEMAEVDRIMVEDLGIDLVQMMENAGTNLAEVAVMMLRPDGGTVAILAGIGGNGGGGLTAARHLLNRGCSPVVVLGQDHRDMQGVPRKQYDILERMGIPVFLDPPDNVALIVDALIGYRLEGDPYGPRAALIEWANAHEAPVLALDTPSGLNVTTGRVGRPCMQADVTMTLALPKAGLIGAEVVGDLLLADISVPRGVFVRLGFHPPPDLFLESPVVRLVPE